MICKGDSGTAIFPRYCSAGRILAAALAASVFLAGTPLAHADHDVSVPPTNLESRFLRAEMSPWDTFGLKLSINGQQVGPRFFSVIPDETLAGSSEAQRHASHARVLHGFGLGLVLTGVGLLIGGLQVAASNGGDWNNTAKFMVAGSALAVFAAYFLALQRQNEILAAVNAYNHDLITGRLGR
jgi:hypothetical protein